MLVNFFQSGDLHDLDRLLDDGTGKGRDLRRVDDDAADGHVGDQFQRGVGGIGVDVLVHLIGHLGHLKAGGDSFASHQVLAWFM